MTFLDGVNTIVSIVAGVAAIISFAVLMADRRMQRRAQTPPGDPATTTSQASDHAPRGGSRQAGLRRRLLLSPLVFLVTFLGAGLLAAAFDDTTDEIDVSAIAGWTAAVAVTLAWVYFAVKSRQANT